MRKLLLGTSFAVLAGVVPVSAQTAPQHTAPCEVPADTTVLGLEATKQSFSPSPIPAVGTDFDDLGREVGAPVTQEIPYHSQSAVVFNYIVDVSGSATAPYATKGNATINLGWDNDSDFDMYLYDSDGKLIETTNGFNPLNGSGETASLSNVAHCTTFRVEVVNYLGVPTSAMTLSTTLKGLK